MTETPTGLPDDEDEIPLPGVPAADDDAEGDELPGLPDGEPDTAG